MKQAIILLFCLVACSYGGRHSPAEIFNGALYFINGTQTLSNGTNIATRDPTLGPLLGNLVYAPAYPGALFGNMSVVFGNKLNASAPPPCETILALISGYTGGYQVFPDGINGSDPVVVHYPIITTNPTPSGHTAQDVAAFRFYHSYEDDNLVEVTSVVPTVSSLFWRRNFPFPPAPTCIVSASVVPSGNSWEENGATHQQYTLTVKNVGDAAVTGAQVTINLGSSASIASSWNLQQVSGTTYNVALFSALASGASVSSSGFIVSGAGSVTVAVDPSTTVCN